MQLINTHIFSNKYVSNNYGITVKGLFNHLSRHADELIENIHYFKTTEQTNGGRQEVIKWTLRGIIKLGMFIRSPQAKNFRLWAELELEKSINNELKNAREARNKVLELTDKLSTQQAHALSQDRHHKNQINGYKSQISQHNAVILRQKSELAEKAIMAEYENLKTRV